MEYQKLRTRLSVQLDVFATIQLVLVYTHDLSVVRLILSLVIQTGALSPSFRMRRTDRLDPDIILWLILGQFVISMALHLFTALPEPDLDDRLHGKLLTEFVGVVPVSRAALVAWDSGLTLIQLLCFSMVHGERMVIDQDATVSGESYPYGTDPPAEYIPSGQTVVYTLDVYDIIRRTIRASPSLARRLAAQDQHQPHHIVDASPPA